MATHSNIPAWRVPWTEEPGGLQSMVSQRVGHDLSDLAHTLGEDGKYILSWKGSAHSLLFYYEAFREEAFHDSKWLSCVLLCPEECCN